MTGDRAIRRLTAAAVLLVAAIAAVVSFVHIEHLAATHGQTVLAALLLPISIDGTVAASSLVMLRAARAGLGTPWLARSGLALSVGATLACNVGYGLPYGVVGALISGWPAVAFVICAEMGIGMVRRARGQVREAGSAQPVPTDAETAATAALVASVAGGNPLSQNQLQARFRLSRAQAAKVRQAVLASANGHNPPDQPSDARPIAAGQQARRSPRVTS